MRKIIAIIFIFVISVALFFTGCRKNEPSIPCELTPTCTNTPVLTATATNTPLNNNYVLGSNSTLDGWGCSNNGGNNSLDYGCAGDTTTDIGCCCVFSFDITPIPAGIVGLSAVVCMYQSTVIGAPYSNLGSLLLEHVVYSDVWQSYGATAIGGPVTFSTDSTTGYKCYDVTAFVNDDIVNARTYSQYRLRHTAATDSNGYSDQSIWLTEETITNDPYLYVIYYYY